ncbi:TOBE domain-containing protein [Synechococcus elongatus]|uniref:TOBE domain-containing protein n=1 Tax=Synechococcus elongatus TaxID=32046 RepID=UPI000F7F0C23|nr:molybdopterin-binding protein [Synechococcus elongatus]
MPRKDQGWITFQLPSAEQQLLEDYCEQTQRSKTDVLRELVRSLPSASTPSNSAPTSPASHHQPVSQDGPRPMRVSARNVFPAVIRQIQMGQVNAEVLLEIAPNVTVVSVITRASVEGLQLQVNQEAYAMIKSSDVMVALED